MTSPGHKAETLLSDWLQQPTYCYLTLHFYRSNRDFFKLQETLSHGSIILTPRNLGLLASVARCQLAVNQYRSPFSLQLKKVIAKTYVRWGSTAHRRVFHFIVHIF